MHSSALMVNWLIANSVIVFMCNCQLIQVKEKVNQSRYRPEWPRGFQEVKVPRLHDNGTGLW
jgi:hypothetical protein